MEFQFDRFFDRRSMPNRNKWNWYPEDVLPLWLADMDFLTPEPIRNELRRVVDHGIMGYELASQSLLETIAGRLYRLYGWRVAPEMIIPIPSVNIGYRIAGSVICSAGEGVLIQPPVFYQFIGFPKAYGLERQAAPLICRYDGQTIRYELDIERFEHAIHSGGIRTSMFLLCNPHNPVGKIFSGDELEWMAGVCEEKDVFVCSDDIHNELLLGGAKYIPLAARSQQIAERTITLLGPGKAFNVSGLGCAFAVIPQTELRRRYSEELERNALEVTSLGLAAARAAYSGACDEWLFALCSYLTANRDYLVSFLQSELPRIRFSVPDATYLAWLDCNRYLQTNEISVSPQAYFLNNAKVALWDGADFGPGGEGFVRLNFACPRTVLEDGLNRIWKVLVP